MQNTVPREYNLQNDGHCYVTIIIAIIIIITFYFNRHLETISKRSRVKGTSRNTSCKLQTIKKFACSILPLAANSLNCGQRSGYVRRYFGR